MKVKCINDTWEPIQLAIWDKYGIITPVKEEIYTVRRMVPTRNGDSYLLEEIRNRMIPTGNPGVLPENDLSFEPTFHVDRFVIIEDPLEPDEDFLESVDSDFSLKSLESLELETYELKRA
jgi:hypothetical protein